MCSGVGLEGVTGPLGEREVCIRGFWVVDRVVQVLYTFLYSLILIWQEREVFWLWIYLF